MAKSARVHWTREHFLIALNLYCKLPFGTLHRRNPLIISVASRMGRTPSSLAMKLVNFAALDPVQRARGIRGLTGASKADRKQWTEFHENLETLAPESEQLLHDLFTSHDDYELDLLQRKTVRLERVKPKGPTEVMATVRVRRGQQFFRQMVLNAYGLRCCISGINVPGLLVASHIKPWGKFPAHRLDPCNGLCLSSIHDAAFDEGLITIDSSHKVVLSGRLKGFFPQAVLEQNFAAFEGKAIQLPEKLANPDSAFLDYHRSSIFQD